MAIIQLSHSSALNPGHDLWVVADSEQSQWCNRLDWLINYQICKFESHQPAGMNETLKFIIQQTEIPFAFSDEAQSKTKLEDRGFSSNKKHEPLLISTPKLIPARWLLRLSLNDQSYDAWAKKIHEVWFNLGQPSLRVFLPQKFEIRQFTESWNRLSNQGDISVIPDSPSSL